MNDVRWRKDATTNTNRNTRTKRFRVRELRQISWHTHAGQAEEEEKNSSKAEAEQAKSLAFSLSASLAFRSPSLLALSGEAIPSEAATGDLRANNSEAFRIGQFATVVAERLFIEIPKQVEGLHADIGTVQLAFNKAPEVIHCVRMNVAVHVLDGMINDLMPIIICQAVIRLKSVGEQRRANSYVLTDMFVQFMLTARWDRESAHLATTFHHSESDGFILSSLTGNDTCAALAVHVSRFAADKGLIDLYLATQLCGGLVLHDFADAVQHEPSGLLGDTQVAGDLTSTNTIAAVGYQPHSSEPLIQTDRRLIENGAYLDGELLAALSGATLPNATACKKHRFLCGAVRTLHTVRPTLRRKIVQRVVCIREVNNRFSQCFRSVHEQSMP